MLAAPRRTDSIALVTSVVAAACSPMARRTCDASRALLLPIWPSGSVFNGTSVIFHEPGKASQPILIAQQVQLSGRILPWSELPGYGPFQGQCHSEPFIVTKVRPAD